MHRSIRFARIAARWAGVCLLVLSSACGGSHDVVDGGLRYVDPPIVDKTLLITATYARIESTGSGDLNSGFYRDPRFYLERTLVAGPRGAFTGVSRASPLRVIRFEVTENFLLARDVPAEADRTNSFVSPLEDFVPHPVGDIVAIYRIESHFDAPASAPVEEGTPASPDTRPWFRRRYMRVDWSQNLVDHADSRYRDMIDVPSEPLPAAASGAETDTPRFASDLSWFELPERVRLHPEHAAVANASPLNANACELFDRDRSRPCGPVDASYRVSFRRRDADVEMSPVLSGPTQFNVSSPVAVDDRFPIIAADHVQRGQLSVRVAARRDLFTRDHVVVTGPLSGHACNRDEDCGAGRVCSIGATHADDSHRGFCAESALDHFVPSAGGEEPVTCVTHDDCRLLMSSTARCDAATHTCGEPFFRCSSDADCVSRAPGSTCDIGVALARPDNRGLCTAPFRSRIVEPIAIHFTAEIPADLEPAARRAIADWNSVLQRTVVRARRRECQIEMNIDAANLGSDTESICNDPRVVGLGTDGDAEHIVVGCHSPVWGITPGEGMHSAAEVADAHAHGWDLEACGPQGTVARIADSQFDTLGLGVANSDEVAWSTVNADPRDGRIVSASAAISIERFEALAADWDRAVRLSTGDLSAQEAFEPRDASFGEPLATAMLDEPFRRPGATDRLRRAFAPLDDVARDYETMYQSAGLFVGAQRLESRFTSLASSELGRRALGGETRFLATSDAGTAGEIERVASPLGGERAEVRAARRAFERRVMGEECSLRYLRSDIARDATIRRLAASQPIDCASDPALCIDGPPPRLTEPLDSAAVHRYGRLHLAVGIFTHEIGHLLGMPHNLAGSADALNYPDAYWLIRGHGHGAGLEPRHVSLGRVFDGQFESEEESANGNIHASSTVMDLLDPYTASLGTGRGDAAACGSLYTGTVEAFRSVMDREHFDQYAVVSVRRGNGANLDLSDWQHGVVHALDYTQIPMWVGGSNAATAALGDSGRFTIFARESNFSAVTGWGDPPASNVENGGHALVPYRAASEADAVAGWPALPYDRGADPFETAHEIAEDWIAGRAIDARPVDPQSLTAHSAIDTTRTRFVEPLRAIAASALPSEILRHTIVPAAGIPRTDVDDVNIAAAAIAMNAMVGQMVVPRSTGYTIGVAADGTPRYLADEASGMRVGRTLESSLSQTGEWLAAGSWFDKLAAIDGVNDTSPAFPDVRATQTFDIDIVSLFPDAALRFAGGMLADDLADVGPRLRMHILEFPDVMSLALPPGAGPLENGRSAIDERLPLDPALDSAPTAVNDAHQLARWPLLGDRRFARFAAIWTDDERAIPDQPTVSFTDRTSGRTYRAFHISGAPGGEGEAVGVSALVHAATGSVSDEAGVTARAILHLQDLAAVRDAAVAAGDANGRIAAEHALRDTLERLENFRTAQRALDSR